jgi:hypothetical protein
MDSGWIEDFLQQYLTQMLNLQGEPHTGREQQDQSGSTTRRAGPRPLQLQGALLKL